MTHLIIPNADERGIEIARFLVDQGLVKAVAHDGFNPKIYGEPMVCSPKPFGIVEAEIPNEDMGIYSKILHEAFPAIRFIFFA